MTRRKLVAGNWKMHGDRAALAELEAIAAAATGHSAVEVRVAVPATLICLAAERAQGIAIGAQDVHHNAKGAHTGCISAGMVREAGATFTIVGHSERRADQCEADAEIKGKAEAARVEDLQVILCVGETLEERDAGHAVEVVTAQLAGSMPAGASADWLQIAYEPVWAIGTGRTPTTDDVAAMHGAIRAKLGELLGAEAAGAMRVLYGGSVNAANAAELLAAADVDGALVGGASLSADKFVPIIVAASGL